MSSGAQRPERRPRADVVRNRAKVLAAARALFAERGPVVQMHEVAAAAGVGIGTVYRHFSSRDELIEAMAAHRFVELEEFARDECATAADGDGVARYLRHVGEVLTRERGLTAAVDSVRGVASSAPRGEARADLEGAVGRLVEQGRDSGALRPDCVVADVYMIVGCISAVIRTGSGDWRRLVDLALDGLRPR